MYCRGNVSLVFANGNLGEIRAFLRSSVRPSLTKIGTISPIDVKGPTCCNSDHTTFLQTLQI